MFRFLALFGLVCALSFPALGCDMRTEARAETVADYVENGRACLSDLPDDFRFSEQMELGFIRLINEERVSRGLQPLIVREDLRPSARFHSLDMGVNSFFGHESPKRRTHSYRISAFDRTLIAQYSAENVAKLEIEWACKDAFGKRVSCAGMVTNDSDPLADAVVRLHQDLMNSPGHRKNILSPDSTHVALGVARTERGVYVTQLFVKPAGTLDAALPVRLEAGQVIGAKVELEGLDFKRFALMDGNAVDDLMKPALPEDKAGNFTLAVRGEAISVFTEHGRTRRALNFMYLPGPAITVEPADPSKGS